MRQDEVFQALPVTDKSPSFGIAAHRVCHAFTRFEDLKTRLRRTADEWKSTIAFSVDLEHGEAVMVFDQDAYIADVEDHAHELSALGSEVVHHLRAALDHLAYNAAWADSGIRNESAQFPIETKNRLWLKRTTDRLHGVNAEHLDWFREAQPLQGKNGWALTLKKLSNTDKHASRIEMIPVVQAKPNWDTIIGPDTMRPGRYIAAAEEIELDLLIYVPEADRSIETEPVPAIPLLWELIDNVRIVANRFLVSSGLHPITT